MLIIALLCGVLLLLVDVFCQNRSEVALQSVQKKKVYREICGVMPEENVRECSEEILQNPVPDSGVKVKEINTCKQEVFNESSCDNVRDFFQRSFELIDKGEMSPEKIEEYCQKIFGCSMGDALESIGPILCQMMLYNEPSYRIAALSTITVLYRERAGMVEENVECDETVDEEVDDGFFDTDDGGAVVCVNENFAEAHGETAQESDEEVSGEIVQESDEEEDDIEQRMVYAIVSAGLSDPNPNVRDAALDSMLMLPEEERSALSLQVLGNDDDHLKDRLLLDIMDFDDDNALTLNFHALASEDSQLRAIARENLLKKTGLSFASAEMAFEWYETEQVVTSETQR